jgi:hypothetical protein
MLEDSSVAPFWDHVETLRSTILRILLAVGIGFILSLFFYEELFSLLSAPLTSAYSSTALVHQPLKRERILNQGKKEIVYELPKDASLPVHLSSTVRTLKERKYLLPHSGYFSFCASSCLP